MAQKSPDAFRTISEVADWLDIPTHVLRFWESRFSQVKPVKRAGGRRYYRPNDMRLIGGIKKLLHEDGMTIRGVQKLLREEGVKYVAAFSKPLDFGDDDNLIVEADTPTAAPPAEVVSFRHRAEDTSATAPQPTPPKPVKPAASAPSAPAAADEAPATPTFGSARRDDPELPFIGRARDHVNDPAPQAAPAIPATPDVPDTDPADDAAEHAQGPSFAARLLTGQFGASFDPAAVSEVAERLRAIRSSAA